MEPGVQLRVPEGITLIETPAHLANGCCKVVEIGRRHSLRRRPGEHLLQRDANLFDLDRLPP
jgi:hypothetical protein